MIKKLMQIGLTKNEATVYIELLQLGVTTVGGLEKNMSLYRQSLYNILNDLEAKGLIEITKRNNKKHFRALDANLLLEEHKKKEKKIQHLIPDLYALSGS